MTALTSYIRHLVVTWVFYLAEKGKLPITEELQGAAEQIAVFLVTTLTWIVVKYVLPQLKKLRPKDAALIIIACAAPFFWSGCADNGFSLSASYIDPSGASISIQTQK